MSGEEEKRVAAGGDNSGGLIPRSIRFLVEQVKSLSQDPSVSFTIRASYCELYNEQVYDVSWFENLILSSLLRCLIPFHPIPSHPAFMAHSSST